MRVLIIATAYYLYWWVLGQLIIKTYGGQYGITNFRQHECNSGNDSNNNICSIGNYAFDMEDKMKIYRYDYDKEEIEFLAGDVTVENAEIMFYALLDYYNVRTKFNTSCVLVFNDDYDITKNVKLRHCKLI